MSTLPALSRPPSSPATAVATLEPPSRSIEHFVTLFDSHFLPIGLALHHSLQRQGSPARLWVVAMDDTVAQRLRSLALPHLEVIPLAQVEAAHPRLAQVKPQRSRTEYCWTLTPFTFDAVLAACPEARRVTYLDADLFMLDDPRLLLRELDDAGRSVLVTEHAYGPGYDHSRVAGRFCVQFMTFDRSPAAGQVRQWWQERVIECCSATPTPEGKFGDQVYVDQWPSLFGEALHIVGQVERTMAPWNASHFAARYAGEVRPVFYHFHKFRLVGRRRAQLYSGYRISRRALSLYERYVESIQTILADLESRGMVTPPLPPARESWGWLRRLKRRLQGTERFAALRVPVTS